MGVVEGIGIDEFPAQGSHAGRRVRVCFRYDTSNTILGTVVRDDGEEPWVTILRLDDGRHVLATECQYSTLDGPAGRPPGPPPVPMPKCAPCGHPFREHERLTGRCRADGCACPGYGTGEFA